MAGIARVDLEASLTRKGFKTREGSSHKVYSYWSGGKKTSVRTFISRGSAYKNYSGRILSDVRKQMKLDADQELVDFVSCELSEPGYNAILTRKSIIQA